MQFIDIMAGSAYASVCLAVIVFLNPVASRELAVQAADQATLDDAISGYVDSVGLVFFATSSPSQICSSLLQAGNSTIAFGGVVEGESCAPAPALPLASASLSLELPGRTVEIQAWLERP